MTRSMDVVEPPTEAAPPSLRLPSRLASLETLKGWLRKHLEKTCQLDLDSEDAQSVLLALVEAATNVIRHAHQEDGRPFEVRMTWRANLRRLELTLLDTGPPFSPPSPTQQEPDLLAESGRGWWLMRTLMDEIDYRPGEPSGSRNSIHLRKTLAPAPSAENRKED